MENIPKNVIMKRELLKAQREVEYLKETIIIDKEGIKLRDQTISELEKIIEGQNELISKVVKIVMEEIAPQETIKETIKKEYPNYLKLLH